MCPQETPSVTVVQKLAMSEPDADGSIKYHFRLNTSPHYVWREFFKTRQRIVPMRVEEDPLTMRCRPDDLQRNYAVVKDAVTLANQDYAEEKRQLIQVLQHRLTAEARATGEAGQVWLKLQQDFDNLEL
jgi:hypothetical protein